MDSIGSAVIVYGAQTAIGEAHVASGNWGAAVYAAPFPAQPPLVQPAPTWQQQAQVISGQVQATDRDEWWKWAAGIGLVSMAAYIVYQKVTETK